MFKNIILSWSSLTNVFIFKFIFNENEVLKNCPMMLLQLAAYFDTLTSLYVK